MKGKYPVIVWIWMAIWLYSGGCSGDRQIRTNPDNAEIGIEEVKEKPLRKTVVFDPMSNKAIETGIASWYGGKFHGRRTANGEIYNMNRLTAAHRTLPFNSIVEVVNLDNRKKIIVRINDRGPFVENRIIDLSHKAAKLLEMADQGIAQVQLRIVKASELSRNPNGYASSQAYYLQAGAFSVEQNARRLLQRLNRIPNQPGFQIIFRDGYHKIFSAEFNSRREAEKWFEILTTSGFDVFIKEGD